MILYRSVSMISASVADCMNSDYAIIHPEMLVVEASGLLIGKEMLGGPVVDIGRKLVGWISEQECLQAALQTVYHNQSVNMVKDIMRTDVLFVYEQEDPIHLAQQMLQLKPKSYPVVDRNLYVLGVVTRRHILKMLDEKLYELGELSSAAFAR